MSKVFPNEPKFIPGTKCFACDKKLNRPYAFVTTGDGQKVFVGSECWSNIKKSKQEGYQPPKGGPRLYTMTHWRNKNEHST